MTVDIEQVCILKGAISFQLFQGQIVVFADFLPAVKACLAAGFGQWNLPALHPFLDFPKKPSRGESDRLHFFGF